MSAQNNTSEDNVISLGAARNDGPIQDPVADLLTEFDHLIPEEEEMETQSPAQIEFNEEMNSIASQLERIQEIQKRIRYYSDEIESFLC